MKPVTFDFPRALGDVQARRSGTAFALHRCALYLLVAAAAINLMLT